MKVHHPPKVIQEREKCKSFLENFREGYPSQAYKYRDQLQEIANRERKVLDISLDDIQSFTDDEFVANIRRNVLRYISLFESIADEILPLNNTMVDSDIFDILQQQREMQAVPSEGAQPLDPSKIALPKALMRRFEVCIIPPDSDSAKKLRDIKAGDIGHLISVSGLVTRASDVKPHITVCTYTCDACGSEIYQEVIGGQFMPLNICESVRCKEVKSTGKVLMQTRGSKFSKYQELRIQELPDQVPVGHIPRTITVHCRGEQTRRCGPGDIVTVKGIFLTTKFTGYKAMNAGLQADTYIEALAINKQKLGYSDMEVDNHVEAMVREIARNDPYTKLSTSIAPEIFGHDDVKKALLLQLVSGVTKEQPDGMKIRGDINICMMGDPGVAKSQLLKYVATVAPRGVYTTGKGSSGVGLTAAVVRDPVTGDMALEGGALVLADMGICCIDEFDKMDESDRTAIHEVMEQQTISIAKAGITTQLNARAGVLAAANPLFGRYNRRKSLSENIDLPNSLLSRFDLLFLILDRADLENDVALSKHVLHVHRYKKTPSKVVAPVPVSLMKQYISIARNIIPSIPQELTNYIVEAYVSLRAQDQVKTSNLKNDQTTMTPRCLLSILRLSQALARLRIKTKVERDDVDEAIRLTHSSKASLLDDHRGPVPEDSTSAIFAVIRDFFSINNIAQSNVNPSVNYSHIEAMILKKGFTAQQLNTCIEEYVSLGVLEINNDRSKIFMLN